MRARRAGPQPEGSPCTWWAEGMGPDPGDGPHCAPQILFDRVRVSQGFSKNGVSVSVTASTKMRVDIPAVGVSVTFDGQVFQVRLSYSHFSHNTEGQCGEWDAGSARHHLLLPPHPAPDPQGGIPTPQTCCPPAPPPACPRPATRFRTQWLQGGGGKAALQ